MFKRRNILIRDRPEFYNMQVPVVRTLPWGINHSIRVDSDKSITVYSWQILFLVFHLPQPLTRNLDVVGSSPIKGPRCFLEQETLPLLLSTGCFQERIQA